MYRDVFTLHHKRPFHQTHNLQIVYGFGIISCSPITTIVEYYVWQGPVFYLEIKISMQNKPQISAQLPSTSTRRQLKHRQYYHEVYSNSL